MVRAAGWEIGNVDVSVVCEVPRLAPNRTAMSTTCRGGRRAGHVKGPAGPKASGALGRREGVACWAVAVITEG
jgi:2C-methyl-D-erythritol 2,4-cyclodiphosphate synthase